MFTENDVRLVNTLASKLRTENIIWIVIAGFQILSIVGAAVGIYNLIVAISNLDVAKKIQERPVGIVRSFEPMTGNIVVLCINVFFGAFIGIVGSLYHIFGVRGFVMDHKEEFMRIEAMYTGTGNL